MTVILTQYLCVKVRHPKTSFADGDDARFMPFYFKCTLSFADAEGEVLEISNNGSNDRPSAGM